VLAQLVPVLAPPPRERGALQLRPQTQRHAQSESAAYAAEIHWTKSYILLMHGQACIGWPAHGCWLHTPPPMSLLGTPRWVVPIVL
jgi:hypothetical protein